MQNIIENFLLIEHLPIIEDILKMLKSAVFDQYFLSISKMLMEDGIQVSGCEHDYQLCEQCKKKINSYVALVKVLQTLHIELQLSLSLDNKLINAFHSIKISRREMVYEDQDVSLWGRASKKGLVLHGNINILYDKNITMSFYVDNDMDDLWELVSHQNKFFGTFMKRFECYDVARFKEESSKFVQEFPTL